MELKIERILLKSELQSPELVKLEEWAAVGQMREFNIQESLILAETISPPAYQVDAALEDLGPMEAAKTLFTFFRQSLINSVEMFAVIFSHAFAAKHAKAKLTMMCKQGGKYFESRELAFVKKNNTHPYSLPSCIEI